MPRSSAPVITGTGLLALDLVVPASAPGQPFVMAGGTCGNVLAILSYLGWASYPIGRLNGDAASAALQADLRQWGVRLDFAALEPAAHTPVVVQRNRERVGGKAHSFSLRCPACGAWLPRHQAVRIDQARSVERRLPGSRVFFFDRVSRAALLLAGQARLSGAVVMFEPGARQDPSLFNEALRVADIVKYSHERLPDLFERERDEGPPLEIVTLGAEGLRYRSRLPHAVGSGMLSGYAASNTGDAAGSGDWCTSFVLDSLAREGRKKFIETRTSALEDALQLGQAAAAWNCGFEGARAGMHKLAADDLQTLLASVVEGKPLDQKIGKRRASGGPQRPRTGVGACTSCLGM